ncbi:helix-turn-helix transcriptional regulator [Paraburkholderia sp. Tr-20389]|uniref:helix-turn-helix domain-containing protein n=1 Tax=Paraburkholderia sp. Tr-20389 TaxID=2703903 RepID=UPI00197CECFF|nr:AraC family transcriptional regulator [Paraburkholderia sp. Tr-20389]MBN3754625.1 helix-turn-helix transcriptional regulator [Paraburkholderia sp. Tr-20389]
MGKIAVDLEAALARRDTLGVPGDTRMRTLAAGDGWSVTDVLCTFGPRDRPFEERHAGVCIAMVVAGAFGYRSAAGRELLTPGSLLLGNAGECFECGHRHAPGDRCVSFHYQPEYFERLAADMGLSRTDASFRHARMPPLRVFSSLIARACSGATHSAPVAWDELAVDLADLTLRSTQADAKRCASATSATSASAWSRVTQAVRLIDETPDAPHPLASLARLCGLSDFYFLRSFERVTGVTPHQYVLRARLRHAALRLVDEDAKIVDIAFDSGFNDVSNFNHAFRAEFGMSPRAWRTQRGARRCEARKA